MDDDGTTSEELGLLNVYEFEEDGQTRHVVAFMEPVLAGAVGLSSHAVVGDYTPGADGQFDVETFVPNPEFIEAVGEFLNAQPANSPELQEGARGSIAQPLFLVDPRCTTSPDDDPEPEDVLGHFLVDEAGMIVPDSFTYNPQHAWFSIRSGVSGLLADRSFYEFLHPEAHP
jgi:hypothetical protein